MKATIVIPTVREEHFYNWLESWESQLKDCRIIAVVDKSRNDGFLFKKRDNLEFYFHEDIDEDLGEDAWIISRRSSAIRNFGTLKALEEPTDFIWHLDDDCLPRSGVELEGHHMNLYVATTQRAWQSTDKYHNHLRGMPYKNVYRRGEVAVSHGTWTKNPDYDAPHQLANQFDFEYYDGFIPFGQYFSMCGMNLAFKPEVAAAMYFAPSGGVHPYDRFDDIWMGIIAKRVFDHLRLCCYTGYPQIVHDRASDPFKNLIKEAPGIEANEGFWQYIDAIEIDERSIEGSVIQIARYMADHPYRGEDYFRDYGTALYTWSSRVV